MQHKETPALPLLGFLVFTLALSLTARQPGGAGGPGNIEAQVAQVGAGGPGDTEAKIVQVAQVAQRA